MLPGLAPHRKRPRLLHRDKAFPSGQMPLLTQAWPDGPKERQAVVGVASTAPQQVLPHLPTGQPPGEKSAPSVARDSLEPRRRTISWEGSGALGFSRLGENSETNVTTVLHAVTVTPQVEAKRCPHVGERNSGHRGPSHSL